MKPLVALDEAGNSGANLLDVDQPVFVLASVAIEDDMARELLPPREVEYKFSSLKRSSTGRRTILRALDSPLIEDTRILISAYHKEFMVVSKIVDLLVEPLAHRDGLDLYERGANLALANLWYFTLPVTWGRRNVTMLYERFVHMVRFPSAKAIQRFYQLLETGLRKHGGDDVAPDLALLLATRPVVEADHTEWGVTELDPAIPSFVQHNSIWTERLGTPFRVVHDSSKAIATEQLVLEAMMSETEASEHIGYDRRKLTFPFTASGIELADSRDVYQLQVADILAGSAAYYLRSVAQRQLDDFAQALEATRAFATPIPRVWPEPKVTPEELGTTEVGGVDINDHVGAYISRRVRSAPRSD